MHPSQPLFRSTHASLRPLHPPCCDSPSRPLPLETTTRLSPFQAAPILAGAADLTVLPLALVLSLILIIILKLLLTIILILIPMMIPKTDRHP